VVDLVTHVLKAAGELLEEFGKTPQRRSGFEIAEERTVTSSAEVIGGSGEVSGIDGSKHRGDSPVGVKRTSSDNAVTFVVTACSIRVIATLALRVDTDALTSALSGWLRA